jgi:hypothetical protein
MTIIFLSTLVSAYLAVCSAYGFHYDAVAVQRESLAIPAAIKPWSWLASWVRINAEYHQLPKAWLLDFV